MDQVYGRKGGKGGEAAAPPGGASDDDSDLENFFKVRKVASGESGVGGRTAGAGDDYASGLDTDSELSDSDDELLLKQRTKALLGTGSDEEEGDGSGEEGEEDEEGDFEDLEAGGDVDDAERLRQQKAAMKARFDAEYDTAKAGGDAEEEGEGDGEEEDEEEDEGMPVVQGALKHMKRKAFALQAVKRKNPYLEFEGETDAVKAKLAGHAPGAYVRVLLKSVPCEFVTNFNPSLPMLLGGVVSQEQGESVLRVRIKKHRCVSTCSSLSVLR